MSTSAATVATKKIKKGQELFTSYGGIYWLEQLLDNDNEAEEEEEGPSVHALLLVWGRHKAVTGPSQGRHRAGTGSSQGRHRV